MEYKLKYIQKILSEQDYLEFDKVVTEMSDIIKNGKDIRIISEKNEVTSCLKTVEDLEYFKKKMIQIYGIYGYF